MKKQVIMGMTLAAVVGISGCGVTNLDEEQNAEAAEYIAGVMLKHTSGYERSLVYPVVTTEPESPEETQAPSLTEGAESTEAPSGTSQTATGNDTNVVSSNINDVLGVSGCKVEYKDTKESSSYKETANASYGIFAESGKKIIAVSFQIKNTSSKDVKLDFPKKDVTYQLELSDGTTLTSELTLLDSDMNYLTKTLKKGKKTEGVVIFMLSKKQNVKNAKLRVIGGNTTAEIDL